MTGARKPPIRSRKPDVVRARILDAAAAEFMARGFAGASTNRILERFGGSKPTMFRHFPTKRAMFGAVVERIAARWRETIDPSVIPADDPAVWLTAFATLALAWITSPDNLFVGRMAIAEGEAFPEIGDRYRAAAVAPIEALVAGQLAAWHAAGQVVSPDPAGDAVHFLDLVLAGEVSRRLYRVAPIAAGPAHVARCVALFLRGISAGCPDRAAGSATPPPSRPDPA